MAETPRTRIYFEGDDDKAFLEGLRAANNLPANWELAKRDKSDHSGKDGLIRQMLPYIRPISGVGGSAVALVDLDDLDFDRLTNWFLNQLVKTLRSAVPKVDTQLVNTSHPRLRLVRIRAADHIGRVVLCPIGLPGDNLLHEYGVDHHAVDDYLLQLVVREPVFSSVSDFKKVSYSVAMKKFTEVAALFRDNGLAVQNSKTYMRILRAVADIRPSTATVFGQIVKSAASVLPEAEFRNALTPLLDDLQEAERLIEEDRKAFLSPNPQV